MKLFRHWVRLTDEVETRRGPRALSAVGWSDEGEEQARGMASEKLKQLERRFASGNFERHGEYPYGDGRPLQEPILEEQKAVDGSLLAVITRNGYGAQVLNTERVLFIDLDFASLPDTRSFWQRLFGKSTDAVQRARDHVARVNDAYPDWAFRVYRTRAGLRLVLLNRTVHAADPNLLEVLRAFGSDPMYIRLCEAQGSFRSRLTPKPWRCGLSRPPSRFPFASNAAEAAFETWLARYEEASVGYATAQRLSDVDEAQPTREVARVLALHDRLALRPGAPLA